MFFICHCWSKILPASSGYIKRMPHQSLTNLASRKSTRLNKFLTLWFIPISQKDIYPAYTIWLCEKADWKKKTPKSLFWQCNIFYKNYLKKLTKLINMQNRVEFLIFDLDQTLYFLKARNFTPITGSEQLSSILILFSPFFLNLYMVIRLFLLITFQLFLNLFFRAKKLSKVFLIFFLSIFTKI